MWFNDFKRRGFSMFSFIFSCKKKTKRLVYEPLLASCWNQNEFVKKNLRKWRFSLERWEGRKMRDVHHYKLEIFIEKFEREMTKNVGQLVTAVTPGFHVTEIWVLCLFNAWFINQISHNWKKCANLNFKKKIKLTVWL